MRSIEFKRNRLLWSTCSSVDFDNFERSSKFSEICTFNSGFGGPFSELSFNLKIGSFVLLQLFKEFFNGRIRYDKLKWEA